jgi:hypothetical protein
MKCSQSTYVYMYVHTRTMKTYILLAIINAITFFCWQRPSYVVYIK